MKLKDFDYELPPGLIAQQPCEKRDHSRMLVVDRAAETLEHAFFYKLPCYLKKGDVLVVNDSRVVPARLFGKKPTGSLLEILLLRKKGPEIWEALVRPAKRIRTGTPIAFEDGSRAEVLERISDKKWLLSFRTETPFEDFLDRCGRPPLPPYIKRAPDGCSAADRERYQTVYARMPGSIAAPTAGLHFSDAVLEDLRSSGIPVVSVTLHVGIGTFLPIETESVEDHRMEEEPYEIGEEAAEAINAATRVIAVGTTATRTLETAADERGRVRPASGSTGLYIYPGYRFKRVGGLITNFHLPQSSLLLLVSAFAGKELIGKAYAAAIKEKYRFYSYGDCMLIL